MKNDSWSWSGLFDKPGAWTKKAPKETEWAEFKHNIAEADEIGEYFSLLKEV